MKSFNINDVAHGYCGNCHDWTGDQDERRSLRNQYDAEGYRYGVQFSDGGVADYWNGRTQRQRAAAYLAELFTRYQRSRPDDYALVRRRPGGRWEKVTDSTVLHRES